MILLAAAGLSGASAGCDPTSSPGGEGGLGTIGDALGEGGTGGTQDPVAAACVGDRWIGRAPSGECPEAGNGWHVSELFNHPAPAGDTLLRQYCLYRWKNDTSTPNVGTLPDLPGSPPTPAEEWLDTDCAAVAAMGAGKSQANIDLLAQPLWDAFASQIDAPAGLATPAAAPNVRVALIDSWPSEGELGTSPHGFGMAAIIEKLTCGLLGGAPCSIQTTPHLALNLLAPRVRDNTEGGYFGHFGRLARQVYEATTSWQSTAGPNDRLIINLSVGWDEAFNQENSTGVPSLAVQAVHDVISWAVCQGALVITAAGNTSGAGDTAHPGVGPTYPAAWQAEAAPACIPCGANGTCPLVYSVGGVDAADLPLANVRPDARPPLAAPSFAVPGIKTLNGVEQRVGPFTGSSVSAAAASAAAAMVWTFNNNLTAAQVMTRLYNTGVDLQTTSDFCVLASCPNIRRISLCQALQAGGLGLVCATPAFGSGQNPSVSPQNQPVIAALSVPPNIFPAGWLTGSVTACDDTVYVPAGATDVTAASACPLEELPTDVRNLAIDPQPGPDPCPACHAYITNPADWIVLELMIYEKADNGVYAQVLTLLDGDGVVQARYDLAAATGGILMQAGEAYEVRVPSNGEVYGSTWRTAMVEWLDSNARTTKTSQLIVTTQ